MKDIKTFEVNNNISINLLSAEGREINIQRKGDYKYNREINLFVVSEDGKRHYTVIKSLSRLLRRKNSKHHGKQCFCTNCLQGFKLELSRDKYQVYCEDNEKVRVEMPHKGSTVEFHNRQNQFKVPFIMYADFESILESIKDHEPDPSGPYIQNINQNIPSGWCVYSKFAYGKVKDPLTIYRGKDCVEKFFDYIKREVHRLYHMFPEKPMNPLANRQWKTYKHLRECHNCYKPFNPKEPKSKRSLSLHCMVATEVQLTRYAI